MNLYLNQIHILLHWVSVKQGMQTGVPKPEFSSSKAVLFECALLVIHSTVAVFLSTILLYTDWVPCLFGHTAFILKMHGLKLSGRQIRGQK